MSLEKADALVVKSVDVTNSSLVLRLFTREFGKISGLAKGGRRLKNPFETSLDLLASIRLSFIRKSSNALDLLTEAKLVRRFRPTTRNLRGLYAGYCVAEALDCATSDYEPIPRLWELADATLDRFQFRGDVPARFTFFEAGMLEELGEFPSTRYCVECGEELPLESIANLERRLYFDVDGGGVVCSRCRASKPFPGLVPTTVGAFKVLEAALNGASETLRSSDALKKWEKARETALSKIAPVYVQEERDKARLAFEQLEDEAIAAFDAFPSSARASCRDLIDRYVCHVLRRRPRSFDFLKFVFSSSNKDEKEATKEAQTF